MRPLTSARTDLTLSVAVSLTLLLPVLLDEARTRTRRLRQRGDEGASVVEWLLITTIVAGAAIAIGAIVIGRLTDKATALDLTTP